MIQIGTVQIPQASDSSSLAEYVEHAAAMLSALPADASFEAIELAFAVAEATDRAYREGSRARGLS